MTEKQFKRKVQELIKDWPKWFDEKADKLLKSGAIELSDFENNYVLPKAFIVAMGEEIKFQHKLLDGKKWNEIIKNIGYYI